MITFFVRSDSQEKFETVKRSATENTQLDRVVVDVVSCGDLTKTEYHRLGDYFESIQITDLGPNEFKINFLPLIDASRYWKDLVVTVVREIERLEVDVSARNKKFRKQPSPDTMDAERFIPPEGREVWRTRMDELARWGDVDESEIGS